ncbi:MAG: hypothetical protein Q8P67_17475, partial [archaeon]|nr:hypothetical protein [archaeon]
MGSVSFFSLSSSFSLSSFFLFFFFSFLPSLLLMNLLLLLRVLNRYDRDGNGLLDREECLSFLSDFASTLQISITPEVANGYFDAANKQALTREEFLTLFSRVDELVAAETPLPPSHSPVLLRKSQKQAHQQHQKPQDDDDETDETDETDVTD